MFKRKALALAEDLRQVFGEDLEVDYNPDKPRRGSFECTVIRDDNTGTYMYICIACIN